MTNARPARGGRGRPATADSIDSLLDEVRRTLHRAARVAETLHAGEPVTLGMRGVLEYLQRNGAAAVPHIARRRFVTRQHIQALVNALLEQDLVALAPNEAHRRSPLVTLTPAGARLIERMRKRETRLFARAGRHMAADDVDAAARTLAALRRTLGGVS